MFSTASRSLPCGGEVNLVPSRPPDWQSISDCTLGSPPGPRVLLTGTETGTLAHSSPALGSSGRARAITADIPLFLPKFPCSDNSCLLTSFALKQDCIASICLCSARLSHFCCTFKSAVNWRMAVTFSWDWERRLRRLMDFQLIITLAPKAGVVPLKLFPTFSGP